MFLAFPHVDTLRDTVTRAATDAGARRRNVSHTTYIILRIFFNVYVCVTNVVTRAATVYHTVEATAGLAR